MGGRDVSTAGDMSSISERRKERPDLKALQVAKEGEHGLGPPHLRGDLAEPHVVLLTVMP